MRSVVAPLITDNPQSLRLLIVLITTGNKYDIK